MASRIACRIALVATAGLLALGLAVEAAAEPPPKDDWSRRGFYLGINGVYGAELFEDDIEDALGDLDADLKGTGGLNARAGYRIFSWLAAEVKYEWMNDFTTEILGTEALNLAIHTFTVGPKFVLPFWRTQPYLHVGLGAQYRNTGISGTSIDDEDWGFTVRPGVGIDFYLTRHIVLNAEFDGVLGVSSLSTPGPAGSINDTIYLSIGGGLQYRF